MNLREEFERLSLADIEVFVAEGREEDLHLDFKLVPDAGLTKKDDRRTFAQVVSGFANSDGGIIVWGVEARLNEEKIDCAKSAPGIADLKRFLTKLNEFTGAVVNPTVVGVEHRAIEGPHQGSGFVVTFVPASDSGPHMAKLGEDRYYRRSGASFVRMEHFEVADMFGRRPHPELRLYYRRVGRGKWGPNWRIGVELGIENHGRGSARAPYLCFRVGFPFAIDGFGLDGNRHHGLPMLITRDGTIRFGGSGDVFIHPGITLPVTKVRADFQDGTEAPTLKLDYEIASSDYPLEKGELVLAGHELLDADF